VRIFVRATDHDGAPTAIRGLSGHTREQWYGSTPHPRIELSFGDDGNAGDDRANDLIYTAILNLPNDRSSAGDWTIAVEGTVAGDRLGAGTVVLIEPNDAKFTGACSDEVVDGSLVVHAGVENARAAFTHVRLELFKGTRPIAQAWAAQTVDMPGTRTFDVTFYGKVIRDSGLDGPYTVRHAVLTTDGSDGRFPGPVIDTALVTRAYPTTVFTDLARNAGNALLDEQERLALDDIGNAGKGGPGDPQPRRMTPIDKHKTPLPQ
jgi:hypothetical protein